MKIKTIELLNKMANDENYRPKVKYEEMTYVYDNTIGDYTNDFNREYGILSGWALNLMLNNEVEIIEEDKTIEELEIIENEIDKQVSLKVGEHLNTMRKMDVVFAQKINELVKEINKMKEDKNEN